MRWQAADKLRAAPVVVVVFHYFLPLQFSITLWMSWKWKMLIVMTVESRRLSSLYHADECVGWFNSTSSMLFGRWLYNYAWMEFIILIDDIDVIVRPKSKKLAACNNVSCKLMVYIPSACLSTAASTDKAKRAQNEKKNVDNSKL